MKKLLLALAFTLVAFPVYAYELLMFSNESCSYCQKFMNEVELEYHDMIYAKKLPLRIIETKGRPPLWFQKAVDEGNINAINSVPTFVVWDGAREVARLTGYAGKDAFYKDLRSFIISNEDKFGPLAESTPQKQEVPHTKLGKFPNGVFKSQDIMDHIYNTETEAQVAANFLGCLGTHTHVVNGKTIHMPCKMD
jgi:hypothetical protein